MKHHFKNWIYALILSVATLNQAYADSMTYYGELANNKIRVSDLDSGKGRALGHYPDLYVYPTNYTFKIIATPAHNWSITEQGFESQLTTQKSVSIPSGASEYSLISYPFESSDTDDEGNPLETESVQVKLKVMQISLSGELGRVPIYGNNPNNEKEMQLNISPWPEGMKIDAFLQTESGTGSAVFENDKKSKELTSSGPIKIRGKLNSSVKDNIRLSIQFRGQELASKNFTVRTWPINYYQHSGSGANGILNFVYKWDSESGNLQDLSDIKLGEIVTYGNDGYPVPPFIFKPPNPTITEDPANGIELQDTHSYGGFKKPYLETSFVNIQYYRFRDPVWDPNSHINLMGPLEIKAETKQIGTNWVYTVSKSGISSSIIMP